MKTPKEKALEIVNSMYDVDLTDDNTFLNIQYHHAIRCALVAVELVLELDIENINFYIEVKKELLKI